MSRPSNNGQTGKSSSAVVGKLREACEPIAAAHGCDLEEVEIRQAGARSRVSVSLDRDNGVDLDTVAAVSREISELLDTSRWVALLAGAYTLEIGSRGVDRPLEEPRHWRRAEGRLVKVDLADKSTLKGRITALTEDGVVLTIERDPRYHSTKPPKEVTVAFADIRRAVVEVDFRNVPADDAVLEGEDEDDELDELDDADLSEELAFLDGVTADDFADDDDEGDQS